MDTTGEEHICRKGKRCQLQKDKGEKWSKNREKNSCKYNGGLRIVPQSRMEFLPNHLTAIVAVWDKRVEDAPKQERRNYNKDEKKREVYCCRGSKSKHTEFIQYRFPVVDGPSLNRCPRWEPHFAHCTSVRRIP